MASDDAGADATGEASTDGGPTIQVARVTAVKRADDAGSNVIMLGGTAQAEIPAPFDIAKYPITVGEYRACVEAGVCAVPDGSCHGLDADGGFDPRQSWNGYTYDLNHWPDVENFPVTCMHADLARTFCGWVGGTLSTIGEWRYAAGAADTLPGDVVYPWGPASGGAPTCEQNPYLCPGGTAADFSVGHHAGGASWTGMEDVLLSAGEITDGEPAAINRPDLLPANAPKGVAQATAAGDPPRYGAIGIIAALDDHTAGWSFRCTWRSP